MKLTIHNNTRKIMFSIFQIYLEISNIFIFVIFFQTECPTGWQQSTSNMIDVTVIKKKLPQNLGNDVRKCYSIFVKTKTYSYSKIHTYPSKLQIFQIIIQTFIFQILFKWLSKYLKCPLSISYLYVLQQKIVLFRTDGSQN